MIIHPSFMLFAVWIPWLLFQIIMCIVYPLVAVTILVFVTVHGIIIGIRKEKT